ncbi:hypothetical protein BJV82DRAFT_665455 [Fennellomyces sp. T-0311]|nr:hypothetical protein BJV82DRAFT_665455 [Fennellomyces sp. T-0311]
MSVQAAVALLNKNATSTTPVSTQSWKSNTIVTNTGTDKAAELKRIRTRTSSGGVASILSKFDQQPTSNNSNNNNNNNNNNNSNSSINSIKRNPSTKIARTRTRSESVRDRAANINRNIIAETIAQELTVMHQEVLNKLQAAEENLNKSRQEATKETDNKGMTSQLRDYEIRIQYLSEKLDQLSQEHSDLERQLDQERRKRNTIDTPISPEFRPFSKLFDSSSAEGDQRRITVDTNITSENDDFWNCLLDVYEKGSSVSTAMTTEEDAEGGQVDSEKEHLELLFVKKQLTAVEKGAQMMLEQHVRDLEAERLQTRTLTEVVHKQDQLIASLEAKLSSSGCSAKKDHNCLLLQEQVELQRIELEDKRGILARLLDEREELLRQVMNKPQNSGLRSRSASVRSSIDVLSEMTRESRHPLSRASSSSLRQSPRSSLGSQAALGRSTPPPTAPPKDPLPPLPPRSSSSMSSILSPATSWSSADYAAATGRYSKTSEIVSSTVYREANKLASEHSVSQQPPVWLDYPLSEHPQQKTQQPQQQESSRVSRQPTIKLRKASSNSNAAFWKGWRSRLGSR